MKKLKYTRATDEEIYTAGKKGLHTANRDFMLSLKEELITAYADYHNLMDNDTLHTLAPLWMVEPNGLDLDKNTIIEKRQFVHDLYKSSRPIVRNHKKSILSQNHCDAIVCPICGIRTYDDWDHYVPRELMPEYSVLTSNLIPLCHDCNSAKSVLWLNDKNNQRLIYNAFIDNPPKYPIIECTLTIDATLNFPYIKIKSNSALQANVFSENIILTTLDKLKLIPKYQFETNCIVKKVIQSLLDRLSVKENSGKVDREALLTEEKAVWKQHLQSPNTWHFLELLIYEELSKPDSLTEWFLSQ